MIGKGTVVKTSNWIPEQDRLLVVTETEEVFDGLFVVETKELGKIDAPVERYWDWALEEVPA